MTLIVTGAAGFNGSNLVTALNARGEKDIVAVDNLARADTQTALGEAETGLAATRPVGPHHRAAHLRWAGIRSALRTES